MQKFEFVMQARCFGFLPSRVDKHGRDGVLPADCPAEGSRLSGEQITQGPVAKSLVFVR